MLLTIIKLPFSIRTFVLSILKWPPKIGFTVSEKNIQSNLSYPNVNYPKLLGYSKTMDSPDFFPIIYCNKTTYYSNFDYPKNSIFRSDLSVPIKENAIKLPFKIRSPNVVHGDHDFFVWSSSINTPE